MIEHSQNGWVASQDKTKIGIVPLTVAGIPFVGGVRGGDVHWLFTWALTRWNREVEKLATPGCWGWAYRTNRNDPNSLSNHASGTAVDINAPQHPNGQRGTYSLAQRAAIKRICDASHGALRSGEFYTHTVDGMHLEINVGADALHQVVHDLQHTAYPILKYGSMGARVLAYTTALKKHGFHTTDTTRYQSPTVAATKLLQKQHGWRQDGVAYYKEQHALGLPTP